MTVEDRVPKRQLDAAILEAGLPVSYTGDFLPGSASLGNLTPGPSPPPPAVRPSPTALGVKQARTGG